MRFTSVLPALAVLLTNCAADVTFVVDVHRDGSALATTREVMDGELYRLVLRQTAAADPFGIQTMQRAGWSVTQTSDATGNHVITMSKLLSREDIRNIGQPTSNLRGVFVPLQSIEISRSPRFFAETDSLSATAPALLPFVQSELRPPYDDLASALLSSAVALHFEVRTPGEVLATNGERAPNGFVRWNLSLQNPTAMSYAVRVVRVDRIVLVVLLATAAAFLLVRVALRRR